MRGFCVLALVFIVISSLFISCQDDTVPLIIDFSKYTPTDTAGVVTGETDYTDWTQDSLWSPNELALLNFRDTIAIADTIADTITINPIYPNPGRGVFKLQLNTQDTCKMRYVFVNEDLRILHYGVRRFTGGDVRLSFDFTTVTAFHKNYNYRMYYGFYIGKDSLIYKGHGDIMLEE